ncbi:hypothetical protein BMS3Abin16_01329 [archaeon BMS3Abin16]|nr:hypothetical protein BMS3Abin16_01329 [archaeon BMS3Abin16]
MGRTIKLLLILNLIGILFFQYGSINIGKLANGGDKEINELLTSGEFLYYHSIDPKEKELDNLYLKAKNGEDVIDELHNKTVMLLSEKDRFYEMTDRRGDLIHYRNELQLLRLFQFILLINIVILSYYSLRDD